MSYEAICLPTPHAPRLQSQSGFTFAVSDMKFSIFDFRDLSRVDPLKLLAVQEEPSLAFGTSASGNSQATNHA